jgi:GntR family transcriptional repressor for pyruvate dehydrogenase complex
MERNIFIPIRAPKAYIVIVESFIGLIAEGKLEYGHRLYNESELIKILDVSRSTLREALRVMEFLGIVNVSPRTGIRINDPSQTEGYPPLIYMLMFQKVQSVELFEVRRALQVEMAGGAAERRTDDHLKELDRINRCMIAARWEDHKIFSKTDYDFHMQIVRSSDNNLAFKLMQTLGIMLEAQLENAVGDFPIEQRKIIVDYHTAIYDAIRRQDVESARELMTGHLEKPYRSIKRNVATYTIKHQSILVDPSLK